MYSAVLIDDMPDALKVLESDLAVHCPSVKIIGKANSVVSAAKLLKGIQPDLIFLDIMLGDGTGFDLLEIVPNLPAKLIFITAFEEYAIRAFRFAAIDYLLKPLDPVLLLEAVEKAISMISDGGESVEILKDVINNPNQLPNRISLHTQDKIIVVEISQIVRCQSDGNNTVFHLAGGEQIFVTKTLKSYEKLFIHHTFKRVHQSHLINTNYIQEYIRKDGGYLKMKNGDNVSVAIRKKSEIIELLDNLN